MAAGTWCGQEENACECDRSPSGYVEDPSKGGSTAAILPMAVVAVLEATARLVLLEAPPILLRSTDHATNHAPNTRA